MRSQIKIVREGYDAISMISTVYQRHTSREVCDLAESLYVKDDRQRAVLLYNCIRNILGNHLWINVIETDDGCTEIIFHKHNPYPRTSPKYLKLFELHYSDIHKQFSDREIKLSTKVENVVALAKAYKQFLDTLYLAVDSEKFFRTIEERCGIFGYAYRRIRIPGKTMSMVNLPIKENPSDERYLTIINRLMYRFENNV